MTTLAQMSKVFISSILLMNTSNNLPKTSNPKLEARVIAGVPETEATTGPHKVEVTAGPRKVKTTPLVVSKCRSKNSLT